MVLCPTLHCRRLQDLEPQLQASTARADTATQQLAEARAHLAEATQKLADLELVAASAKQQAATSCTAAELAEDRSRQLEARLDHIEGHAAVLQARTLCCLSAYQCLVEHMHAPAMQPLSGGHPLTRTCLI